MYVHIDNPTLFKKEHMELCKELNLTGRIIVAHEGLNGTVCGLTQDTEQYVKVITSDPRFSNMHIKRSEGIVDAFPKMGIKVRDEIVTASLEENDIDPNQITGIKLSPDELKQWFEQKKDFVIIDMRNTYEHKLGRFKNSIEPRTKTFKELPQKMEELSKNKGKTVVTVCTGGVRCEKASGYLMTNGFEEVYQLDGGIVTYMEKYPGQDFEGSLFVFDKRQTMHFDEPSQHKVIGICEHCNSPTEKMRNCIDVTCNKKFIGCDTCMESDSTRHCPHCVGVVHLA